MISWGYALRELHRRPGRSLLSLLSVVIAVSAIVAVTSATATTRQAYQQVFEALAGRADLEVVARGSGRFQQDAGAPLRSLPYVRAVVPVLHRATILYADGGKKAKVLAVGIVPNEPESVAGYQVVQGHLPTAADEIALESELAAALKIQVGDEVRLLTSRGRRSHKVAGILALESAARLHQGGMVLAPLDRLQRLFNSLGEVDALHVYLTDPKRTAEVVAAAAGALPAELRLGVPTSRSGLAEETLLLTEVSLDTASALSFTTAIFIVLSVFLMNVGERRQQLSILRAVGATRRQIVGMVCREALLMGIVGTLLGVPLGVYGGHFLIHSMAALLQTKLPETPNLGWALAVGSFLGPVICLLAAWYPAHKASLVSPLEGMRPVVTMPSSHGHRSTTIAGLIGLLVTLALTIGSVRGDIPIGLAVVGLVLALVSIVLLVPVALAPAVKLLAWPLRRLLTVEGEMAQRLVLRHAGRSALTIGVLFIAVAAGVGTGNAVFSITDDIRTWYERTITADFLLRATMPDMSGQDATSISESLRDQITALGGVEKIDAVRLLRIEARGRDAILVARDFHLYDRAPLDLIEGDPVAILKNLEQGEVVVGSVLAERLGLRAGDTLPVIFGDRSHAFRVAGVATEYSFGGSVAYLDRRVATRLFKIEGVDSFLIQCASDQVARLEPKLRSLAEDHGLLLQSFAELQRLIDAMVAGVTGGLWILLTLSLFVGALGVVNTLTMNVLEQTRELGMLRAIGMRRGQIVKTVLGQAACIGIFGILGGGIAGTVLARMINICLGSMFGHYVAFALRWQFMGPLLAVAFAVVMLSALVPARRAANLNPIQAMRQH